MPYPSLYDPAGAASTLDFPFGLPDTYLVDAAGTIRYVVFGETGAKSCRA